MARKGKAAESAEQKPSAQVSVLINEKQLNVLLRHCKSTATQTGELTGSLREKIGYAVDKQGLHKKAFAELRRLDKMEPEQLLEYETHRKAYMDMAGITARMDAVGTLGLDGEDAPNGDDVGGRPANVESLADKRKRRAAEAGETEAEEAAVH